MTIEGRLHQALVRVNRGIIFSQLGGVVAMIGGKGAWRSWVPELYGSHSFFHFWKLGVYCYKYVYVYCCMRDRW